MIRPFPSTCEVCGSTVGLINSSFGALCSTHYEEAKERVKTEYKGEPEQYGSEPICPYCGHKYSDAWELGLGDEEEDEAECGLCESAFKVTAHWSIDYSTRRMEVGSS